MNKVLRIVLNILVFILIAGFGYYVIHSTMSKEKTTRLDEENQKNTFISFYKEINSLDAASDIFCFDIYEDVMYIALFDKVSVFDLSGKHQRDFEIESDVCDIVVEENTIYLLYDTRIDLYFFDGHKKDEWEACSDNSDYCAITTTKDYVFVTDAENKNIVQYNKQGELVRFIKSSEGFIIPSYAFDIISINDTIYCSNSGRHQIESYTLDGKFIASFGDSEAFAGCCNPVYLAKSSNGHILTSEKGNPRISCYGKTGKFYTVLFNADMLGGGTSAYEMQVSGENIYIANGKTITVYAKDEACLVSTEKSCADCKEECPLRNCRYLP